MGNLFMSRIISLCATFFHYWLEYRIASTTKEQHYQLKINKTYTYNYYCKVNLIQYIANYLTFLASQPHSITPIWWQKGKVEWLRDAILSRSDSINIPGMKLSNVTNKKIDLFDFLLVDISISYKGSDYTFWLKTKKLLFYGNVIIICASLT